MENVKLTQYVLLYYEPREYDACDHLAVEYVVKRKKFFGSNPRDVAEKASVFLKQPIVEGHPRQGIMLVRAGAMVRRYKNQNAISYLKSTDPINMGKALKEAFQKGYSLGHEKGFEDGMRVAGSKFTSKI